jgi:hypothetical protein
MNKRGFLALAVLVLVAGVAAITMNGCASTVPNADPTGTLLPTVKGKALDGTPRTLPADLAGKPAVLLVGYVQGTQFDIDRWVIGLLQTKTPARIYEIPTIDGLVPTVISGWIDSGMRGGIPKEDWPSVVTVYGSEAARIVAATGNDKPRNARVLLLDAHGRVVWFHDRGFSPSQLLALDAAARDAATR